MKIKYIRNLIIVALTIVVASCEDFLDVKPTDTMSDEIIWSDQATIRSALASLYSEIYLENFDYHDTYQGWDVAGYFLPAMTDEATLTYPGGSGGSAGAGPIIFADELFAWFGYDRVRHCNSFLKGIKTSNISEALKAEMSAEVRILRAIHYFNMVKRHGGVPLVLEEQNLTDTPLDSLPVARSKEQEIWDFIGSEMDSCINILPDSRALDSKNARRFTKWTAYAVKSRAMLYAASIAKYGKVDLNGLVGVNPADANKYWQAAYDASQEVIAHGPFQLYNADANKTNNFRSLFLKPNNEYIIYEEFLYPIHANSVDLLWTPFQFRGGLGYGNILSSTIELAEAYEYTDGTPGTLRLTDGAGALIHYQNPVDLFKDKDPRFLATLYVPGDNCRGGILDVRRGILDNGQYKTATDINSTYGTGEEKMFILGRSGVADFNDYMKTGMCPKKFCDESNTNLSSYRTSHMSWPMIRLSEMYLNAAEAAFELGNVANAVAAINPVRERAGIKLLTESDITLDKIRNEHFVEFAFENHRYWDLRRWRTAHVVLNQFKTRALWPWFDWQTKSYVFTIGDAPKGYKVFLEKSYYTKFRASDMNSNPKMIQNPGY